MEQKETNVTKLVLRYWAKTFPDGKPAIDVFHHCLNVGCVAWNLAALHDIEKISQGFH
jgi:hypothetical protein